MGLFTNTKKLCPICGNPTPRLLATKFDGQPICKECDKKLDLPLGTENSMSLADFREYLAAYEVNRPLRDAFNATYRYDSLLLDERNGLIRLKNTDGCWAIEKKHIKSFYISEDDILIFENGSGVLKSYPSDVSERADLMRPAAAQFYIEKREYERRAQLEKMRSRNETPEERSERERVENLYRPHFEMTNLFKGFQIAITLDHPYWKSYTKRINAPEIDRDYPDIDDFLKKYNKEFDELHTLAVKLMKMIDPAAGESCIGGYEAPQQPAATGVSVDAVTEIKRYKELFDQGLITSEEFSAKKRQLLGI